MVDIVVEAGETTAEPTTVVDWSEGAPEVVRVAARATRRASRADASAPGLGAGDALADRERRQAQHVAGDQRPAVVGEPGDHRLHEPVVGVGDRRRGE